MAITRNSGSCCGWRVQLGWEQYHTIILITRLLTVCRQIRSEIFISVIDYNVNFRSKTRFLHVLCVISRRYRWRRAHWEYVCWMGGGRRRWRRAMTADPTYISILYSMSSLGHHCPAIHCHMNISKSFMCNVTMCVWTGRNANGLFTLELML